MSNNLWSHLPQLRALGFDVTLDTPEDSSMDVSETTETTVTTTTTTTVEVRAEELRIRHMWEHYRISM